MKDRFDILLIVVRLKFHWLKLAVMDVDIKIERLILKHKRKRYERIKRMYMERTS